jgi:hypothetical protein
MRTLHSKHTQLRMISRIGLLSCFFLASLTGCSSVSWTKKAAEPERPIQLALLTDNAYEPQLRVAFFKEGIDLIDIAPNREIPVFGLRMSLPPPGEWCLIGDARHLDDLLLEVIHLPSGVPVHAASVSGWTDGCLARRESVFEKAAEAIGKYVPRQR